MAELAADSRAGGDSQPLDLSQGDERWIIVDTEGPGAHLLGEVGAGDALLLEQQRFQAADARIPRVVGFRQQQGQLDAGARAHSAFSPLSPVRNRMACSTGETNTLPSPTLPVWACC